MLPESDISAASDRQTRLCFPAELVLCADPPWRGAPVLSESDPSCRANSTRSAAGADDLDFQVPDFLAQSVAVDAEQIGGADLVSPRCGERGGEQRVFDLAQDAVIKPGRRQSVAKAAEILGEMPLDRGRE